MTINSFKSYLVEEEKTLYFVWGRMNPPTAGHEKLLDFLKDKAGTNPFRIYLTQSEDDKKNPIPFVKKVKFARKGFPQYARQIMLNKKLKTIFDAMTSFYDEGFKRVVVVAGGDRIREYDVTLNKYNGKKGRHGFYNFERITVLNAGDRDPESKGIDGVSGTKLRGFATSNDFTKFAQYMPKRLSNADAKSVFNAVRSGMGLKEEKIFRNHVQFEPVSEKREDYVKGNLYSVGDNVIIRDTGELCNISHLGTNYVIVESGGKMFRKWLEDIELVERQDPDISDRKGTQPAKYHAGLKKSTKAKRDAQFKKQAKMADDDPAAYKPAPGDKTAKTKPSKYTKAYKDMFEEVEAEITVGNYNTTHFHMCGSAIKTMKTHADKDGAEELTRMQDQFFKFEKQFLNKEPSADDKAKALADYKKIMAKAQDVGIEKEVKKYMDMHRDSIIKGDPKPGFGKVQEKKVFSSFSEMHEDVGSALKKKSEKSGISVGTLRKVYNRGVAAWKTGHRPGTTPSQWGHARVNAFIVKKKKGGLNHDKDLA